MSIVAQLSKPAAKLLLRFLETDGESEPVPQAMVEAGVSRTDYYEAKRLLQTLGFIDRRGNLLRFTDRVEPTASRAEAVEPVRMAVAERVPAVLTVPTPEPEPVPDDEGMPLRQRAAKADRMDDTGDWNSSNSPRRKRRLAQVRVVQDAWDQFFGEQLTPDNAKDFLSWNDDSAEAVLEVFEDAKRRVETGYVKTPLSWLRSKFIRRAKEQPQQRVAVAAGGGDRVGTVETGDAPFSDPVYERKLARFKALGLNKTEGED